MRQIRALARFPEQELAGPDDHLSWPAKAGRMLVGFAVGNKEARCDEVP
jgi:hypothetical protein